MQSSLSGSFLAFVFSPLHPPPWHHIACGILVPGPGMKPSPLIVEVQCLNHWTAREVPTCFIFSTGICFHKITSRSVLNSQASLLNVLLFCFLPFFLTHTLTQHIPQSRCLYLTSNRQFNIYLFQQNLILTIKH